MTAALIELRNLRKSFTVNAGAMFRRTVGQVVAVDDVSFDIYGGETVGCVGGSGSGKSTLGRLILNLIRADSGEVKLDGTPISNLSPSTMRPIRKDLQIVFQDPLDALNPRRTVAENIARPLINFRVPSRKVTERVRDLLSLVGLNPDHANRYPHEFSGGQCQRAGIARALALGPRFMFLDEPVSALDVSIQAQILNLLKDLKEKLGLTYLFVAHDLKIIKYFCDRIVVLHHGRVVEVGHSEDVYRDPLHPYTQALLESVLTIHSDSAWERVAEQTGVLADDESQESALRAAAAARAGCIYVEACPHRFEPCTIVTPEVREVKPSHRVACHLYDPSFNSVPAARVGSETTSQHDYTMQPGGAA